MLTPSVKRPTPNAQRSSRAPSRAVIESLEPRRLLSAGLAIDAITSNGISLNWTNPDGAHMELEVKYPGDDNFRRYSDLGSATRGTTSLTNLMTDTNYDFRLRTDRDGNALYVNGNARTLPISTSDDPSMYVPSISVHDVSDWFVKVAVEPGPGYANGDYVFNFWAFPKNDPYGVAVSYNGMVPYGTDGQGRPVYLVSLGSPGTAYTIYARSIDSQGQSYPSAALSATTEGDALPTLRLQSAPSAGGKVQVTWSGGDDPNDAVSVYCVKDGQVLSAYTNQGGVVGDGGILMDAGPTGSQFFAVVGIPNSYCFGSYSNFVDGQGQTQPAAPENLSAYIAGTHTINLLWDNVPNNEEGYRIQRKPASESEIAWMTIDTVDTDVSVYTDVLPGNDPNEWVKAYDWRVVSFLGTSTSAPATTQSSGLSLQSVTYSGWITGGGSPLQSIARDDGTGNYTGPQWMDGNLNGQIDGAVGQTAFSNGTLDGGTDEHTFPLSYLRSLPNHESYMSVGPVLAFNGTVGANWQMKGSGGGYTFSPTSVSGGGGFAWASLNADQALPDTIASQNLSVAWKLSTDGGNTWFDVGTTANHLYVTGAAAGGTYETVLDLGCTGASGKRPRNAEELAEDTNANGVLDAGEDTNANGILDDDAAIHDREVIDGVWGKFSGRSTKRIDGAEMEYTHVGLYAIDYPGMLVSGIGQCTAWSRLLIATVGIHGIDGTRVRLTNPTAGLGFRVTAGPAQGTNGANYGIREFGFHEIAAFGVSPNRLWDSSYGKVVDANLAQGISAKIMYERGSLEAVQYWNAGHTQVLEYADDPNIEDLVWS